LIFLAASLILNTVAKTAVAIVPVDHYIPDRISAALQKGLDLLDGLPSLIRPRSKVFVKINHLSPASAPERGIITHPVFTGEVLKLLKDMNCVVTVGDDIQSSPSEGFHLSGYREVCHSIGVRLVNLKEAGFQKIDLDGTRLKTVYISRLVLEADSIVNLPKLKTHSFTVFTGAIKNMFGVIPHGMRIQYHRRYSRNDLFSEMLVDVFSCARPQLTIMDGVVAMEGEGPAAGRCRATGIVVAGPDGVAVDAVASHIIGFNPMSILTTSDAHRRGLGQGQLSQIDVLGEKLDHVRITDFKHSAIATGPLRRKIPSLVYGSIYDYLALIPEVLPERCTGCLECIGICPAGAAKKREEKAWLDQALCIHCMCCHEVCRFGAIRVRKRTLGRLIHHGETLVHRIRSLRQG
jgi:uncharacterized protein (DUF362 family)/NAD-dependent dihydropyrimidine dehydrogenase PreA subunit